MASHLNKINEGMNSWTFDVLAPQTSDEILEIGFGGGELLKKVLLSSGTVKVQGLELSDEMISAVAKLQKEATKLGRLVLKKGNATALPYEDSAFTKIVTVNTIYFWSDALVVLKECFRVLKPNGQLVLCFNAKEDMLKWPGHQFGFKLYEVSELKALLNESGFKAIEVKDSTDRDQGKVYCVKATR